MSHDNLLSRSKKLPTSRLIDEEIFLHDKSNDTITNKYWDVDIKLYVFIA